jgi:hypothetical protein
MAIRGTSRSTPCARYCGSDDAGGLSRYPLQCRMADAPGGLAPNPWQVDTTAVSDKAAPCPLDRVSRQFQALAPSSPRCRTSPVSAVLTPPGGGWLFGRGRLRGRRRARERTGVGPDPLRRVKPTSGMIERKHSWSLEHKRAIVSEAQARDNLTKLARRRDNRTSQFYTWRHELGARWKRGSRTPVSIHFCSGRGENPTYRHVVRLVGHRRVECHRRAMWAAMHSSQ